MFNFGVFIKDNFILVKKENTLTINSTRSKKR